MKGFVHPVVVQARADAPVVVASDLTIVENHEGVNGRYQGGSHIYGTS